jgi:DNA-binding Lrp family transcriptional regulator
MLLDDGQMKVREITETIGISKEPVGYTRKGLQA